MRTLSATESATCSLVMTPATSGPWGTPWPRVTTAMIAPLRHQLTESQAEVARQEKLASLGVLAAAVTIGVATLAVPIAVTSEMTVNYLKPVHLQQPLRVESREVKVKGRKHINRAEILNDKGEVLARSSGLFIAIDPQRMFARFVEP